jgi:hypothetical protein
MKTETTEQLRLELRLIKLDIARRERIKRRAEAAAIKRWLRVQSRGRCGLASAKDERCSRYSRRFWPVVL